MSEDRTCRDCGKEFTLTDEQIRFFENKTDRVTGEPLALPRRCEPCRIARRVNKS